jgi:hypothetical protein
MGLKPPHTVCMTLQELEAAGMSIVHREEQWFIQAAEQLKGPYASPEIALEESARWLAERQVQQVNEVGGRISAYARFS